MTQVKFIIEEAPEGGYIARAVGHSIFTKANTLEELNANICEAVQCHFDDEANPSTTN